MKRVLGAFLSRTSAATAARKDGEADGALALQLVRAFEDHGSGWFWQTDRQGRITYLTAKVSADVCENEEAAVGAMLTDLFRMDENSPDSERSLAFHLTSRTGFTNYSVRGARHGVERWWSISGRPVFDHLGHFQGFCGSGSDLSEQRRAEAEIQRLAMFDALTGLANRQRMRLSLDQMLSINGLASYRATTLLLLDLDRFKAVNDTLGHQTGDALLKQVSQRLTRAVGDKGLVGRLGGDEFEVVLPGEGHQDTISEVARTIISALSHPYFIGGSSISIGCSIGVAIAPDDGGDAETLTRNADLALYAAKADGRGVHRFFRPELLAGAQGRKQLEDDLRSALAHNQFHLVYQPVVSTRDPRIVGYEALIRWDHPVRGPVSPAEFIPIAEDCGLIEEIGSWVLRTATIEAATWPDHVRVAVNVSPIQFANPALPSTVTSALARSGIAPARLELEITEGVFLTENAATERMFTSLKGLGVRLALDDFGTGYSSLGYLRNAPFDKIKIDQSFVRGAAQPGSRNAAIIRAIVTLAETLHMETTAEGVEMQDEVELIRNLGCSHIQGFVYGKPVRCEQVLQQLQTGEGEVKATGHRHSRAPRARMLRWATLRVNGASGEVRIRDLSSSGAMIDGIEFPQSALGCAVQIEMIEGEWAGATVRWARGEQAGIQFDEPFSLDRLNTPLRPSRIRKSA
ncbi:EAL domain-containing protein [Sphingomonas sp. BGYR3]|uniref:EAL domain-containing protein n=1 Tax=Sphingomonas sp. BGYR3 TaxID=2975483 RepID=UPI0021A37DA3|nr:EAL domain-containing protein [Sphingomonas sp. BGYR3]MDG5488602.1 EAL domain-containing protein [Sphingomonas sp. BGYR3]